MQTKFASVLLTGIVIVLTGCGNTPTEVSATENELCLAWGDSLPTKSRSDTGQTVDEINIAYGVFADACPAYDYLIPS